MQPWVLPCGWTDGGRSEPLAMVGFLLCDVFSMGIIDMLALQIVGLPTSRFCDTLFWILFLLACSPPKLLDLAGFA